jgi:hypothetical protein
MVQVHTCVSVHCGQCGNSLGDPGFEAHAAGWWVGRGGRLWCSACAPVLICEAEGHEFSAWRHLVTLDGHPAGSEYRHCRRCCLHESCPAGWLLLTASADTDAEEVA